MSEEKEKQEEKLEESPFKNAFKEAKCPEDFDRILRERTGAGLSECATALTAALKERADEMLEELPYVSPHGDYGKMMEDKDLIRTFLLDEAAKDENWEFQYLEVRKTKDTLMELVFFNKAVDDGDTLKGFVFLGFSGKIRHCFPQVNS
jgi:hypothetical protein